MKCWILLFFAVFSETVFAVQSVSGSIGRTKAGYYLVPQNSTNRYALIAADSDVQENLNKLTRGDFLGGQGTLDTINKKITLTGIDYVGLKKLLGPWVGVDGLIAFKDFSTMKFAPRLAKPGGNSGDQTLQKLFKYTLSPSDGDEWALFLSDDKSTSFATLQLHTPTRMTLKIFDSESGLIIRTLELERP